MSESALAFRGAMTDCNIVAAFYILLVGGGKRVGEINNIGFFFF
jgi:hypothetical protein